MKPFDLPRLDRRTAIKWIAAAGTALLARPAGLAADAAPASAPVPAAKGYGTDPNLMPEYKPGDFWPLTFTDEQRRTAAALCALIIPADEQSPDAAELRVHDFIDEWISAPYPDQQRDRPVIVEGLAWIDAESRRRFDKAFAELDSSQRALIADDICLVKDATSGFVEAARFFARFRDLAAGGYYARPEAWPAIGYVGNIPSVTFEGPPPEVIERLGIG